MSLVFALTLALYAVACALYLAHLAGGADVVARAARAALALGFATHAVAIGGHCLGGLHPFATAREALSFVAWLMVGGYLALSLRLRVPTVGALLVPVALVLTIGGAVGPAEPGHTTPLLLKLHIGLALVGVALFAVAAADGVVYLASERQLKKHRAGRMLKKSLPLETLDGINRICTLLGFPIFTVAMVAGAIVAMRHPDAGVRALVQPQYVISTVAWALFATLLALRVARGWRGRRAAIVTLAGFAMALSVLAIYYFNALAGAAA